MSTETLLMTLIANNRLSARKEIVEHFLEENYGTGKGDDASRYIYTVEQYEQYRILLRRPAPLNKGFDFIVLVDGIYFNANGKRRHQNPSHSDIISILDLVKRNQNGSEYEKVKLVINEIYNLQEPSFEMVSKMTFVDCDGIVRPLRIILLAIKWLFLEQDITYWNYSGRAMLMNGLRDNDLA